jgi:hypothetical protein
MIYRRSIYLFIDSDGWLAVSKLRVPPKRDWVRETRKCRDVCLRMNIHVEHVATGNVVVFLFRKVHVMENKRNVSYAACGSVQAS